MISGLRKKLKQSFTVRKYKNVVEACHLLGSLRIFLGVSVFSVNCTSKYLVISSFSRVGLVFFLFYAFIYLYSVYGVFIDNQTILEKYYNTKLKHYGEVAERILTTAYVLYALLKLPFDTTDRVSGMQFIVDVDKAMEDLGDKADYARLKNLPYKFLFFQIIIYSTRILSVSLPHPQISFQKLFHVIYFDDLLFVMTSSYCFYLYLLRLRYRKLNRVLKDIQSEKSRELFMFRVGVRGVTDTVIGFQNKYIAEKMRKCGRIYDILYRASNLANKRFGFSIWITLALSLSLVILHLYYFMEATALGLFHDPEKYINFLCFVSWQIGYAVVIIFLHIYFSEITVKEARKTSQIAHAIINSNLDTAIKTEALNLSLQILHQAPVFAGCGLHKLDYELLLEGGRSVVTFLVIILQFVTDSHSS